VAILKAPVNCPVALHVCEATSQGYRLGLRPGHIGIVIAQVGNSACCDEPADCSTIRFANDSGMIFNMCVNDENLRRLS
jgi:hypothetical protein